ncbi:PaaI family thioesterase [Halalkalibacter oceani]|uniref:PaaI family thioesterase n=1 Tax=Halalkalibacter oceani TaxID=1653776 RepID=UPI003398C38D
MNENAARESFERALQEHKPEFEQFFLAKLFGLSFSYGEDTCTIELESKDFMFNPQGTLHGGVISFILDVSMGHLCKRFLGAAITLELKTQFLRPVRTGTISCTSSFSKKGNNVIFLESKLYNEEGKLAAVATSTWYNIE